MLLLHGLASNARFWDLTAPHLYEYHVVAVDQRGHGLSSKPEDGYDFSNFAADVAAVIEALGLRRPVVVGHSWGAMLALAYAAAHPGRATAIALIGCGTFDLAARDRMRSNREERTDDNLRQLVATCRTLSSMATCGNLSQVVVICKIITGDNLR